MLVLQPKLRFPEFEGNWISKSLGSFADVSKLAGYEFTKHIQYEEKGKIIALRGLNIKNNSLDLTEVKYIDNSELNKLSRSKLYVNDIMFTYIGTIGEVALIKENDKFYLAPNVSRLRITNDNIIPAFILQYFNTRKMKDEEIAKYVSSSSQPALTMESVRKFEFQIPSIEEQTRIANFLSSIDEKLNLLKEKKSLLEDYKKGIMQKIFNQEIRFKDDNGKKFEDWKESILSEVVNLFHGYQFRTSDFTTKGIAVIKISNVIGNNLDLNNLTFIKKERFENFKNFEINNDDILMSLTGNIGRIIEVKDKPFSLLQNYRVGKFIPLNENIINKPFLKYLLASDLVFGRFSQLANQSAQANFGKQDMDKINISYPPIDEQTKIANFLSAIDEKIELVSNQIQDTQEYKKGLLQQMFV